MKTTANVYLLPINKDNYPCIGISIKGKNPNSRKGIMNYLKDKYSPYDNGWNWELYQLYLTLPQSDLEISKIKKGDWYYDKTKENVIFPAFNIETSEDKSFKANPIDFCETKDLANFLNERNNCEKIIATTDSFLKIWDGIHSGQACPLGLVNDDGLTYINLPSIKESFITYFIEQYNKKNVLKSIEIELKHNCSNVNRLVSIETLKLTPNNEVIICIPEEITLTWKQAELMLSEFICKYCSETSNKFSPGMFLND